jgi:hypothetical protein
MDPKKKKRRSIMILKRERTELVERSAFENPREWQSWLLRAGIAPDSNRSASDIGIYTDFT